MAADALLSEGAKSVSAYVSHGVLSEPALERLKNSILKELVTTNTIKEISNEKKSKIRRLSIAPLIAEAVKRIDNYKNIIVETFDRVVLIKLNRPNALNALSKDLITDLNHALNIIEKDKALSVIVITG